MSRRPPNLTMRATTPWLADLGWPGLATLAGLLALFVFGLIVLPSIRPPSVEDIERDIWHDWARLATDSQGLTIVDLLLGNRRAAGQQLLNSLGRLIQMEGDRFVVRTAVRQMIIRDNAGDAFARWDSPTLDRAETSWRELTVPLMDAYEGQVGTLFVSYRFHGSGLDSQPNVRKLQALYNTTLWLAGVLAVVLGLAVVVNLARIRERAARLKSQQITLDLAHQMCHELRNGLWAFSLEGRNLRQLFFRVDVFFSVLPKALEAAMLKTSLDEAGRRRFLREFEKILAEENVAPKTDVLPTNDLAKQTEQQIGSFARYINLTVEELDRYLLGSDGTWRAEPASLTECWREACDLLQLRLQSAGVEIAIEPGNRDDRIAADRRALIHSFINVVKNALEAMADTPPPRRLRFAVRHDTGRIACTISNNGPPLPAGAAQRIFEAGFTTKTGVGRGAGLAIVRESIERMNGTARASTEPDGQTCFCFTFPLLPPQMPA